MVFHIKACIRSRAGQITGSFSHITLFKLLKINDKLILFLYTNLKQERHNGIFPMYVLCFSPHMQHFFIFKPHLYQCFYNIQHKRTDEMAHFEMICAIVHQLTRDLSMEELKGSGFDQYYVDHTIGLYPQAASGVPFGACAMQSKGDAITDLFEDMAAEQKARTTYDNILRLTVDEPDVYEPIKFLRAREVVHFREIRGISPHCAG